ncbi:MAG: hypothetical protein WD668_04640, partial [Saccharospirillum sp.]
CEVRLVAERFGSRRASREWLSASLPTAGIHARCECQYRPGPLNFAPPVSDNSEESGSSFH